MAVQHLIENEMIFPPQLLAKKQAGQVSLHINVDAEGKVKAFEVGEGADEAFVREALRLLEYVLWEPALYDGKAVAGIAFFELEFKPGKFRRILKQRGYDHPPALYQPSDSCFAVYDQKSLNRQVEVLAPEGYSGMVDFIRKNLEYPELAIKRGISGTVRMDMVVESSGRITNLRIIQSVGAGCDEEAMRLMKMLRFRPGLKSGIYVRSNIQLSINFALPDEAGYRYFPTQQGGSMQ
jgi:protein TonB